MAAFLSQPGLPFAQVLAAERIERVFARHGNLFGAGAIDSTAVLVWSFLGPVLHGGKLASCPAAVACVVTYRELLGESTPTSDTGDDCRARAKLSAVARHDLTVEIAAEVEDQADAKWLWKGPHAKLIDGFTCTMPDTAQNQAEYPAPKSQQPGVGLPIARAAVILSLASACVMDLALGPYAGQQTGETALLRRLLGALHPGDVAVMDRDYCSFMMMALLLGQGVQVCARMHPKRQVDFRRGRRLGQYDPGIVWTKPQRPTWMDPATYATIPDTLELREIRDHVVEKGRRTQLLTVVTTLTDAEVDSPEEIAERYGFRWNAELDIGSIKPAWHLCHVRCKSPEMVRKELWTTRLGYNLIRTPAAAAALLHDKPPRPISFTGTCQSVLASGMLLSCDLIAAERIAAHGRKLRSQIAECEVAHRPGRLEPRVLKRRRHGYKLMPEPRALLKARLMEGKDLQ